MSRRTTLTRRAVGTLAVAAMAAGGFAAAAPAVSAVDLGDVPGVGQLLEISYPATEIEAGTTLTVDVLGGADILPLGAAVSVDQSLLPAGVTVTVDPSSAALTISVGEDVAEGTVISIPVTITVPNPLGEDAEISLSAEVTVVGADVVDPEDPTDPEDPADPDADLYTVDYPATTAHYGDTITITPTTDAPEGTKYQFNAISVPQGVTIDESTGIVTITVPEDRQIRSLSLPIRVIYPDDSRVTLTLAVTVTEEPVDNPDPGPGDGTLPGGSLGNLGSSGGNGLFGSLGS